jgi:hypothetical protein
VKARPIILLLLALAAVAPFADAQGTIQLANNPTKRPNFIVLMYGVPASSTPSDWPCAFCGEYGTSYEVLPKNPTSG